MCRGELVREITRKAKRTVVVIEVDLNRAFSHHRPLSHYTKVGRYLILLRVPQI